jgi:hypothetical protein
MPSCKVNQANWVGESGRKAVAGAFKAALPGLLVVAVAMVYVFGIFAAYRAAPTSWLKTIVYSIALGTKISGNKAQLWLMHRTPHLQPCTADQTAFCHELLTALLCRVLVMSMPDANTFWRTLDGNNANVIEYATTAVSALMLYLLPQLGVF